MEDKKNMITRFLHHNMAMVGGFMGGYAVLVRSDFLGNAQTSNLVYLMFAIVGKNGWEFLMRIGAAFLYILAAMSYVFIKNKTNYNVKKVAITIDAVAILVLGFIPAGISPILALYPIFFAMSFQWNSFPGGYGYASSSIFSTNNVRQVSLSFAEYLCDGDRKHLHKTVFFLGTLAGFHLGVVYSYFAVRSLGVHAVWLNLVTLVPASILLYFEEKITENNYSQIKNEGNIAKLDCKSA